MSDMPRPRPPHLHRETTRHGKTVWFVRIGKGPRIRIRGDYGSPEFTEAYQAALNGTPVRPPRQVGQGIIGVACRAEGFARDLAQYAGDRPGVESIAGRDGKAARGRR